MSGAVRPSQYRSRSVDSGAQFNIVSTLDLYEEPEHRKNCQQMAGNSAPRRITSLEKENHQGQISELSGMPYSKLSALSREIFAADIGIFVTRIVNEVKSVLVEKHDISHRQRWWPVHKRWEGGCRMQKTDRSSTWATFTLAWML